MGLVGVDISTKAVLFVVAIIAYSFPVVESVHPQGAADLAGVEKGDVLVKIGSLEVEDKEDIVNAIERLKLRPNVVTEIVVLREGEEETIELKVGDKNRVVVPKKEEEK